MGSDSEFQELVLQRTRSSKTPIFRLPIETTVEIFRFTQSTRGDFLGTIDDSWSWITITHVCRRWRNIAISTQTLWTHIDAGLLSSAEQAKMYLERSGSSKLVVRYEQKINSRVLALECLHLVLGHIHRIRALHILNLEDAPANIQNALQNPAPELQNLTLYMYPLSNVKTLLNGHTPKLTRLSLHANLSSWANTPIMQNLSDLNIGSSTSPLTLRETYSILMENPSIKKFRILCQADAPTTEDLRPLPIPIELPSLKYLGVSIANYDSLSELLKNIIIPNEMNWKIFCHKYPLRNPNAKSQRIIPNFSCDSRSSGTIAISISPEFVTIEDQCCNGEVDDYNIHPRRTLKCSWDIEDHEDQMTLSVAEGFDVIRSAVKGGFWSSAKALIIDIEAKSSPMWSLNFSHYTWRKLLQSLPKLLILNIRHVKSLNAPRRTVYESHARLLKALTHSSSGNHDSDSDKSCFICPDLKSLHLCGINLRYELPYLVHYLSRRASNGLQLWRLELCEPYCLTDEILRCLRNIGIARDIEVVWNVHPLDDSEANETDFEDYDTDVDSN